MKIKKIFIVSILVITLCFGTTIVNAESKETHDLENYQQDKKHDIICSLNGETFIFDNKNNPFGQYIYSTKVYNEFGDKVSGFYDIQISTDDIKYGYNLVEYTFRPVNSITYNETSGSFTIVDKRSPKINIKSNQISISNLDLDYYDIYIDGDKVISATIKNLKSNTKYEIEIYQKANEYLKEDTLIDTFTVKTK
jgi:hypothetical protein